MKNTIIIAGAIIIAAIIIVSQLPRYQFVEYVNEDPETKQEFVQSYIFDMVTGELHSRMMLVNYNKASGLDQPANDGLIKFAVSAGPRRPMLQTWQKQEEVFGRNKYFDNNDWSKWLSEHPEWRKP